MQEHFTNLSIFVTRIGFDVKHVFSRGLGTLSLIKQRSP